MTSALGDRDNGLSLSAASSPDQSAGSSPVHSPAHASHTPSQSLPSTTRSVTYDECLGLVGTGPYHYQLLALCGWANAADAIEILCASFIMSSAEELSLSDSDKGWIGAIVFMGMLLGGLVWGALADQYGRKPCLVLCLTINGLGGFVAGLCATYSGLLFCRLIAGIGVGGSIPIIFTYFIEFLPKISRGQFMIYLAWFWMIGALYTASMAWIIIPHDSTNTDRTVAGLSLHSWRIFTIICSFPSLVCSVLLLLCPESPQWLLTQRRLAECKTVLNAMFVVNRKQSPSFTTQWFGLCSASDSVSASASDIDGGSDEHKHFHDRLALLDIKASIQLIDEERGLGTNDVHTSNDSELTSLTSDTSIDRPSTPTFTLSRTLSSLRAILVKTRSLFSPQYRSSSIKLILVWFGLSFGFYGITLWIPETLRQINADSDDGGGGLDIYAGAFLAAACNLPGNIVSIFTVRTLGRAKTLGYSIGLSTLTIALTPLASSTLSVTIVLSVFSLVSVSAWNALNISTTELYSTTVRSTAFGFMAMTGRAGAILGNILFGEFIGVSVVVPMLITAIFLGLATLASLTLTETKDAVLT